MKLVAFILLIFLFACRPCKELTSTTIIENDTLIIYRDSLIVIPADSSWFQAMLECDSANKVIIRELELHQGQRVNQTVTFKDKYIYITAEVDSEKVYVRWKELHTSNSSQGLEVKTEYVKVYPKWLVITAFAGAMLFITVLVYIIVKIRLR